MQQQCLFCGHHIIWVHVHGHYQCPVCNTNVLPCCDGDNCDTNQLIDAHITKIPTGGTKQNVLMSERKVHNPATSKKT